MRRSPAAFRLREEKLRRLEASGVILLDPSSAWVGGDVRIGAGTVIYPAVVIEGRSVIGKDCRIHAFVNLIDARLGSGVVILSSSVIEGGRVGKGARVGPFTHLRPGTIIRAGARVGNFVEMKNTVFGRRSVAAHLSYLGDAAVGDDVNIGAGTITCNFDRFRKNPTSIGSGAFIGSGAKLVAPVKVGRNAVVGAGSTITKDVSAWALAVARSRQKEFKDWAKRKPGK
jgi:bifunctional UDP-N-acetylglucosamine pyrophosphorylase/glucosamine-1-phosphate N-acetyltransferase